MNYFKGRSLCVIDDFSKEERLYLFEKVRELNAEVKEKLASLSQDELIILSQVFSHCVKMVEQLEVPSMFIDFPIDEMYMSVQGMEFTFDEIENSLKNSLKNLRYKFFSVV